MRVEAIRTRIDLKVRGWFTNHLFPSAPPFRPSANKRHGSKGGGTIVTVALQFDRVPATTQKTAAGASPRKTGVLTIPR